MLRKEDEERRKQMIIVAEICFVVLAPLRMLYRVPRSSPGSPHPSSAYFRRLLEGATPVAPSFLQTAVGGDGDMLNMLNYVCE
jgi:hypothetical protein